MYCAECKKLINKVINYKNIFKLSKHNICDLCFSKYIFIQSFDVVPINNYLLYLNTLFDNYKNSDAMASFLKPYYIYYLKNFKDKIIMYFDTIDDDVYSKLNLLNMSDIFIITLKNQLKGGNNNDD